MSLELRPPTKVIVSYSHEDVEALERLQVHLKPLTRDARVVLWDDTRIEAGDRWRDEIREAIASADVAVLLVSADFLASDFIREHELPPLVEAERAGAIKLMAVVLGPCRYNETPELERHQSVNPPSRPLSALSEADREAVWVKLAGAIEAVAFRREPSKLAPKVVPIAPRGRPYVRTGLIAAAPLVAVLAGALVIRESGRTGTAPRPDSTLPPVVGDPAKAPSPKAPTAAAVLAGLVIDGETLEPLAGVTLAIQGHDSVDGRPATTTSDSEGRFRLDGLAPEPVRQVALSARKDGYGTSHTDPTVGTAGHTIKLTRTKAAPN